MKSFSITDHKKVIVNYSIKQFDKANAKICRGQKEMKSTEDTVEKVQE